MAGSFAGAVFPLEAGPTSPSPGVRMADPFIGEIKMIAWNYPPRYWAFCDGSILAIATNQALFALLGTTYGGNGVQTFALPDLRARTPMGQGQGQQGQGTVIIGA